MSGQDRPPAAGALVGLMWMTATAACYAASYVAMRLLSDDISIYELTFLRSVIACLFLGPWILATRPRAIRVTRWKLYGIRSVATYAAMMCTVYGIVHVQIADVTSLLLASPLFTVLFAAAFLKEKVGFHRWMALLAGIAGALLIIRPGFTEITFASFAGLFAAFGYGIANAGTKALTSTDHPDAVAFWMYALIIPISAVPAAIHWTTPGWNHMPLIVLLGLLTMLSQYSMARAFRAADTSVVLPAHYLQMPFAAGLAFLILSQVPSIWVWPGAVIIAGSAYYTVIRERRAANR
ncbi:MAG: drug/metabolite transporter (DMT)-like permease [Paracoccaceae bacterium]|jgi:drug/metabolite transporter (DMT)-like permease